MNEPTLTLDGAPVAFQPGQTLLEVARGAGIEIPTLCHLEACGPQTSCLVCLVKVNGKMRPSCATVAEAGTVVESETEEVHEARKTALELLFSDHVGDCLSPCQRLCPLQLDIPAMIRGIERGNLEVAGVLVREALPLPGILGRLCHHPCEQGCRRGAADGAADIRGLERFVAERDLQAGEPPLASCEPAKGKSVAIVGAGPAGLAGAFDLARKGYGVAVFDRHERAGGSLRRVEDSELPSWVLNAEIARLGRMGVEFLCNVEIGGERLGMVELRRDYDAVLLAVGAAGVAGAGELGVTVSGKVISSEARTARTSLEGVFAAGAAVKPVPQLLRAMVEGRGAAECIHRFLQGEPPERVRKPFSSVMGKLNAAEMGAFLKGAGAGERHTPCDACAGFNRQEATGEAARCLQCDCRSKGVCALQRYAQLYEVDAGRFRGTHRDFEQHAQPGGVLFEPGKCILCGICVRLAEQAAEPLGLTFVGRGFEVRVAAPFHEAIERGLQKVAAECVRACPTGALTFRSSFSLI